MPDLASPKVPQDRVTGELVDSSHLMGDQAALRQQAEKDGYLLMKGLLPREAVLSLRAEFLEIMDRHGLLDRSQPRDEAIVDADAVANVDDDKIGLIGSGVSRQLYREVQMLESFHRLPHHPNLIKLYETLFDDGVLVHPRHIARLMVPGPAYKPTPQHQDFTHIQGTTGFWTCWFPLGDCPMELGGLAVLQGSHKDGVYQIAEAQGAGNKESIICEHEHRWLSSPMEAGDILTFNSHTVHRGMPNQLLDRTRISCDLRFQPLSEPVEKMSLDVHMGVAEWDEIYAGWDKDDLKYYWKQLELNYSDWDDSLVMTHEKIC